MDRDRIVKRLEENGRAVAAHFDAPEAEINRRYAPGKWTVRQILAHLADCELIDVWRFGRAVAEPDSSVEPFDQDRWAARLTYADRPISLSRNVFLAARQMTIYYVRTLPDESLSTVCSHAEKGKLDGYAWAELSSAHAERHLGQIDAARSGKPWIRREEPKGWLYGSHSRAKSSSE